MSASDRRVVRFNGLRVQFDSDKTYDELVAALLADVGDKPVPIEDLASAAPGSWDSFAGGEVQSRVGRGDFILLGLLDHGGWIKTAGIGRKALRAIIGNPRIAVTMLRHDVMAGLYASVELLVIDRDDERSSLIYVKPSSLMVVDDNPPLHEAAEELDAKVEALAAKVTGQEE